MCCCRQRNSLRSSSAGGAQRLRSHAHTNRDSGSLFFSSSFVSMLLSLLPFHFLCLFSPNVFLPPPNVSHSSILSLSSVHDHLLLLQTPAPDLAFILLLIISSDHLSSKRSPKTFVYFAIYSILLVFTYMSHSAPSSER